MESGELHLLLLRTKAGDQEAFSQVVVSMQQQLFRYCYLMLGNKQDAEDLVQEAFVRAYYKLDRYEEQESGSAAGWLFTIARNLCLNTLKRQSSWRRLLTKVASAEVVHQATRDRAAEQATPMAVADELPEGMQLLRSLAPKQRELVVLKVLHEMSYEEMSEIIGVSAVNLRKRFERIRSKLQAEHAHLTTDGKEKGRLHYEH